MTVGEKIKFFRELNNLTQEQLAVSLKTTKQTIYKYETGIITNIPLDKIQLLAERFNIRPSTLAGWDASQELKSDIGVDAGLSEEEQQIIKNYRAASPELKKAIETIIKPNP